MSGQMVGIFFFRPTLGGGTTTFTAHLFKALQAAGADPMIYRVGEKTGRTKPRQFGKYEGVEYIKVGPSEARAVVKAMPTVMGSPANSKFFPFEPDIIMNLMKLGMRTVIHDPNEFTIYDHLGKATKLPSRPICIRPTMQKFYPDALWIPHPYHQVSVRMPARRKLACSIARIASVKRPRLLLDANRILEKRRRIELKGAEYRLYTYNLQKKYGDVFQQCGGTFQFPMTFEAPVGIASGYQFNFDMTYFPDDGGGTQYAQMEAMNARTVNVMHEDWWRFGSGEMKPGKHVITVGSSSEIAHLLRHPPEQDLLDEINHNCERLLKNHAPKEIGAAYLEEMLR